MDLCGLRPSPLGLPAHLCPPCRSQYTPNQTHSAECPWVEVRGIEPLSRTPPDCRNYNHASNYGGGEFVFQGVRSKSLYPTVSEPFSASLFFASRVSSSSCLVSQLGVPTWNHAWQSDLLPTFTKIASESTDSALSYPKTYGYACPARKSGFPFEQQAARWQKGWHPNSPL